MNYLIKGKENQERMMMVIGLTSIKSKKMQCALIDYFCTDGNKRNKRAVANIFDVQETNFCRDIKKVNVIAGKLERLKEMDWPDYQALKANEKAA